MTRLAAISAALLLACIEPAFGDVATTLTIYVEDALPNGHVFVSLSDGRTTVTKGFYSQHKSTALLGLGGGIVRDDTATRWTVRKTFSISNASYTNALDAIAAFEAGKPRWCVSRHCGDFAQGIALAAGVNVPLPWGATGKNRPGKFRRALEKLGAESNPAYEPAAARTFVRLRHSAAVLAHSRTSAERLALDLAGAKQRIDEITAAFHQEYDGRYAAYSARCNVALPAEQAAVRRAECETEWTALEAIRLRYDAQLAPLRRIRGRINDQLESEQAHLATEAAAVDEGLAALAAVHALDPSCRSSAPPENAAMCAVMRRGTVH